MLRIFINAIKLNAMKNNGQILKRRSCGFLYLVILLLMGTQLQAQRIVVRPKTTKVVTRNRTVVVRKPVIRVVPKGAVIIHYNKVAYHVHKGILYRPVAGGYTIVRPPLGFRLKVLPLGYRSFVVGKRIYYYYNGVYYIKKRGGFVVVAAPSGRVFSVLPVGYKTVIVGNKIFYLSGGYYYERIILENGKVYYYNIGSAL